ncbi:hypothetical protein Bpfe_012987, partial [Biomphalaria pfeifferi]
MSHSSGSPPMNSKPFLRSEVAETRCAAAQIVFQPEAGCKPQTAQRMYTVSSKHCSHRADCLPTQLPWPSVYKSSEHKLFHHLVEHNPFPIFFFPKRCPQWE